MFDWFETHSHGSRHRGAGLGLSIVRSFVELHGGKVRIELDGGPGHHGDLHVPAGAKGRAGGGVRCGLHPVSLTPA